MYAIGTVRTLNSSIDTTGWDRKGYRVEKKEQIVYTVDII